MNVDKEKLSVIGVSIKVNRKEKLRTTKAARWTQVNFIRDICSTNTYIHIEHGILPRFTYLYEEFAKKLGLQVGSFPDVDKALEKIVDKLYQAIEFYEVKKIEKYIAKALALLEEYSGYLWYCDLYELYKSLGEYYNFSHEMDESKLDKFIDMIGEFDEKTDEILKSLAFSAMWLSENSFELEKTFNLLNIENSEFICNKINTLYFYYITEKTRKFLGQLIVLQDECEHSGNISRLLDVYSLATSYFSNFDREEMVVYIHKLEALISENHIPKIKLADCYYNLGMSYYYMDNFEKAISFFKKNIQYDTYKTKPTFIFIASAQRKSGQKISLPKLSESDLSIFSNDARLIYKYFSTESQVPDFIKQKFIMEKILPSFRKGDALSIKIMRDELEYIVQKTKQYKDSVVYDIRARNLMES